MRFSSRFRLESATRSVNSDITQIHNKPTAVLQRAFIREYGFTVFKAMGHYMPAEVIEIF